MKLERSEREVILTIADDEACWTVYTDSGRLTSKLLKLAARYGANPERVDGGGYQFRLPMEAVRFGGPKRVTERQRAARRKSMLKARLYRAGRVPVQVAQDAPA